jgi:hypothetical protein
VQFLSQTNSSECKSCDDRRDLSHGDCVEDVVSTDRSTRVLVYLGCRIRVVAVNTSSILAEKIFVFWSSSKSTVVASISPAPRVGLRPLSLLDHTGTELFQRVRFVLRLLQKRVLPNLRFVQRSRVVEWSGNFEHVLPSYYRMERWRVSGRMESTTRRTNFSRIVSSVIIPLNRNQRTTHETALSKWWCCSILTGRNHSCDEINEKWVGWNCIRWTRHLGDLPQLSKLTTHRLIAFGNRAVLSRATRADSLTIRLDRILQRLRIRYPRLLNGSCSPELALGLDAAPLTCLPTVQASEVASDLLDRSVRLLALCPKIVFERPIRWVRTFCIPYSLSERHRVSLAIHES